MGILKIQRDGTDIGRFYFNTNANKPYLPIVNIKINVRRCKYIEYVGQII